MKLYESLFKQHAEQPLDTVFAHFYPSKADPAAPRSNSDFDEPFRAIARQTIDGADSWSFHQPRFQSKHAYSAVPKLKNYLNYTFKRLVEMEQAAPGMFFSASTDDDWITFNTGLQNMYGSDLLAVFQRYKHRDGMAPRIVPDWVFKGCHVPSDSMYRAHFGNVPVPDIASYSTDARDFVFDPSYRLEKDVFEHLFERAKQRAGMPNVSDEVVRTYLRGAIEGLVPKIRRNYKVAIPVYYVEEKRMQLLLPFEAASGDSVSSFLVERDDATRSYRLKTVFDLDHAYFSARLITRPDKEWLNP